MWALYELQFVRGHKKCGLSRLYNNVFIKNKSTFLPLFSQTQTQPTLRIRILQSLHFQLALYWSILTQLCLQLLHSSMWYVYQPQFNCVYLFTILHQNEDYKNIHSDPFAGWGSQQNRQMSVDLKYLPSNIVLCIFRLDEDVEVYLKSSLVAFHYFGSANPRQSCGKEIICRRLS